MESTSCGTDSKCWSLGPKDCTIKRDCGANASDCGDNATPCGDFSYTTVSCNVDVA